ncbi:MAG: cell division protein cell division transport system permease protein [Candidatus Nomurabacteria bacterium]|nr:cell division protein cell division transport system permease protein [Candidatus Nomurabacteria bacterium]
MFWVRLKRVIRSGWINFRRNTMVSYAAILVTTITLIVVTTLFLFQAVLNAAILNIQTKVDIAVYFTPTAPEDQILSLEATLQALPEVASVQYISADQQVLAFRDRHNNDYLTLQALDELGNNPFGGLLQINAKDPTQYDAIAQTLEGDNTIARSNSQIIERINYSQNKQVIDQLNNLIFNARRIGLIMTLVLSLVSIIIMHTTLRLTIYMAREEIGIMRLVGASGAYVRAPFLVQGVLYGAFAWLLTNLLFLPLTYIAGLKMTDLLGINLYSYYTSHFFSVSGLVLLIGLVLGVISSLLAVRRYLNV